VVVGEASLHSVTIPFNSLLCIKQALFAISIGTKSVCVSLEHNFFLILRNTNFPDNIIQIAKLTIGLSFMVRYFQ